MKQLCVIESPLAGDFPRNIRYARWCMRALLDLGYAPFASHLLYPQCYDDNEPKERETGIAAGLDMRDMIVQTGGIVVFCVDLGYSSGMRRSRESAPELSSVAFRLRIVNPAYWANFLAGKSPAGTEGCTQ